MGAPRHSTVPASDQWTMDGRTTGSRLTVTASACTVPVKSPQPIVIPVTDRYCASPPGVNPGPPPTTDTGQSGGCQVEATFDPQLGLRIRLLVDVSLCVSGSLVNAICTLLGPTEPLNAFLENLVGEDGAVTLLLNGLGLSGTVTPALCNGRPVVIDPNQRTDVNPGRRVTTTVSGVSPTASAPFKPYILRQTTIVPRPQTP